MKSTTAMSDLVATMRQTASARVAKALIANAQHRLGDIEHIGWPRLEQSLRDELQQLRDIARERGFQP